tara:strand:+ start:565 stop:5259 length:4695 start_codon:yes stop_codon:yes gene_type:complete
MSHILKKLQVAGAFRKKKPKPPVYRPPVMGELQYGASHSYVETLDLISDGPIGGLVNPLGRVMDGINILQGIYLDDTAVAISKDPPLIPTTITEIAEDAAELKSMEIASVTDTGTGTRGLRNFFKAITQQQALSRDGKISTLAGGAFNGYEHDRLPNVSFLFVKVRKHRQSGQAAFFGGGGGINLSEAPTYLQASLYIRAFIQEITSTQSFYWYLDKELNYGGAGINSGTAAFRDERFPRGGTSNWSSGGSVGMGVTRPGTGRPQSLYWTDANTLASSKFFLGFSHSKTGYGGGFLGQYAETNLDAEAFVSEELTNIIGLWNDNNEELATANLYQKELAAKALTALGWENGNQGNLPELLSNSLHKNLDLFAVIKANDNVELDQTVLDEEGNVMNMSSVLYGANHGWNLEQKILNDTGGYWEKYDVTCPEVDSEGTLTGKMHGFILLSFLSNHKHTHDNPFRWHTISFPIALSRLLADIHSLRYTHSLEGRVEPINEFGVSSNLKFNYSNVLAEVNKGEETQTPLNSFRSVFIDHIYNKELFGPFGTTAAIGSSRAKGEQKYAPQRIAANTDMHTRSKVLGLGADNFNLAINATTNLPLDEGSDDIRYSNGNKNYSEWGKNSLANWDERALSSTHTVYNPNVTKAFITLNITSLQDTIVKNVSNVGGDPKADFDVGGKFPTVLNIRVETGTVGNYKNNGNGGEVIHQTYNYRIVALIEGSTLIDIGNPDSNAGTNNRDYVVNLDSRQSLNIPFDLPEVSITENKILDAMGESGIEVGTIDQDSVEKRYIKVTKLSHESNSVLISKQVSLNKVTEIIELNMPYPFSAIVGTKLDSRAFGAIPKRTYDCKLKLVKIPNNYYPTKGGADFRYYNTTEEFDAAEKHHKLIYEGDWDGSFHTELGWTDNPAWILYDLLTSSRYGMGTHIDANKINKWQLYKIGRFCDAVDDNGYFEGVSDGRGGLEPRFSCNIVFDKGQKIYDAITTITEIFRGRAFFGNSEINFVDDRPKGSVNLFTNESVKDGQFFYSNNRRDQQYNTIEISYKDRFDNFSPKIEVVEDEEDLRERGVFKTRIEGVGITSRAMARRVGQHKIFSSIDENQTVAFTAGLESLLCQPGDLVTIEDELKTNKTNFGKILAVDIENETIRISNSFASAVAPCSLTVYNPTGRDTIEEIEEFATIDRTRYEGFTVTGEAANIWSRYTGDYEFSGYTSGYDVAFRDNDFRFQEYGLYTGVSGTFLYFETGVTGWTFASGTGAGNVGAFDLASGDFIQELTGAQTLLDFNTGKISAWTVVGTHRGGPVFDFSGFDPESFVGPNAPYNGVLNSEISNTSPDQMAVLSITGYVWGSSSDLELRGFNPYGSVLSGFDKPQLLPFIKLGSAAKFEIPNASPFIYKVIAMKESAPNEYLVSATKYDTGKFNLIEKNISIENEANTLSYQSAQTINGTTYTTLNVPLLDSLTTGKPDVVTDTFVITGMWDAVTEGTGYNARLTQPNGSVISDFVTTTGHEFTGLDQVGVFNFCVNALGNRGGNAEVNTFFDSTYDCSGIFVVYDELLVLSRSFVNQITIL